MEMQNQNLMNVSTNPNPYSARLMIIFGIFLAVVFATLTPFQTIDMGDLQEGTGSLAQQAFYLCILTLFIGHSSRATWGHISRWFPYALILLLTWASLSVVWSADPAVSLRRVIFTGVVTLTIALVVQLLNYKQIFKVILFVTAALMIINLVSVFVVPEWAIHQSLSYIPGPPSWAGLYNHKNTAGLAAALTVIIWFCYWWQDKRNWWAVVISLVSIFFLYQTDSKTSLGLVLILLGFFLISRLLQRNFSKQSWMLVLIYFFMGVVIFIGWLTTAQEAQILRNVLGAG
jgi:exopolysaccharide production protein ExoQ